MYINYVLFIEKKIHFSLSCFLRLAQLVHTIVLSIDTLIFVSLPVQIKDFRCRTMEEEISGNPTELFTKSQQLHKSPS